MDAIKLKSTQFSKFSATTKDLINMGVWFLQGINFPELSEAKFYLITDTTRYIVTEDGTILKKVTENPPNMEIISSVTFDDISSPAVNFNINFSWA